MRKPAVSLEFFRGPQWSATTHYDPTREILSEEEIARLTRQIGDSVRDRLAWALDFVGLTPEELTDQRERIRRELTTFVNSDPPGATLKSVGPAWLPRDDELEETHRVWRNQLRLVQEALQANESVLTFPENGILWAIPRIQLSPRSRLILIPAYTNTYAMALFYLLGSGAHFLGLCKDEDCRKMFVAKRNDQVYCSGRCRSRATMRALRFRGAAPRRPKAADKMRRTSTSATRRTHTADKARARKRRRARGLTTRA
jgi:hypothetical protein